MGQSHDFWRAFCLFVAQVASFVPERSEGESDATTDKNKLHAREKSFDYHYYQYTRPNRTNSFNKKCMKLWYGNVPQCIQTKVVRMKGMYIFEVRVVDYM